MSILKKWSVVIPIFLWSVASFAQEGVTYFDESWEETTKANASFYRPRPEFVDSGYIVKDYYINTTQLQGVGFSKTGGDKDFNGEVIWYHPNGAVSQKAVLVEGIFHGPISNYNDEGEMISNGIFRDGEPYDGTFYSNNGNYYLLSYIKDGNPQKVVMLDAMGDSKARVEGVYNSDSSSFDRIDYYDRNGEFIGSGTNINEYHSANDGIEVGYAYFPMSVSYIVHKKDGLYDGPMVYYYSTGQIKQKSYYGIIKSEYNEEGEQEKIAEVYFDKYGKKLDSLTYQGYSPYEGGYYNFFFSDSATVSDQIESIVHLKGGEKDGLEQTFDRKGHLISTANYVEGLIVGEKLTFDESGKVKYRLVYRDGSPWVGQSLEYGTLYEYTEGEQVSEIAFYESGAVKSEMKNINENKITTYFSPDGKQLGQLKVNSDYEYNGTEVIFDGDDISEITGYKNNQEIEKQRFYKSQMVLHTVSNGTSTFVDTANGKTEACEFRDNSPWEGTFLGYSYDYNYVATRCQYKNGKLEGEYLTFDYDYDTDSVQLVSSQFYKDGELNGLTKNYSNGLLVQQTVYQNGEIQGEVIYYKDGIERARAEYRDSSPWNGTVIERDYYDETSETISHYFDGNLEGEKTTYENGEITRQEFYHAGVITRMISYNSFIPDSVLELKYVDGIPFEGKTYIAGDVDTYEHGNLVSSIAYGGDDNTVVIKRRLFDGDKCDETTYYTNGKIKQKQQSINNDLSGESVTYSINGKVMSKGKYAEGIPVSGSFVFFNTYDDANYWLVTIVKQTVSAVLHENSEDVMQFSSTLMSKQQTMKDLVKDFMEMLRDKKYDYDIPFMSEY